MGLFELLSHSWQDAPINALWYVSFHEMLQSDVKLEKAEPQFALSLETKTGFYPKGHTILVLKSYCIKFFKIIFGLCEDSYL